MLHLGTVGLRAKLMALVLLILLPLMILRAAGIVGRMQDREDAAVAANQQFADVVGVAFMRYLETLWAAELALGEAIAGEGESMPPDQVEALMRRVMEQHPSLSHIAWISPEGTIQAKTAPGRRGLSMADSGYIQLIMQGADYSVSSIQPDTLEQRPAMMVARAIRRDGTLRGIVSAAVNLDQLGAALNMQRTDAGVFGVVDPTGYVAYRSDLTGFSGSRRFSETSPTRRALEGTVQVERRLKSQFDGIVRIVVAVPVKEVGWAVYSATPVDSVLAPVRRDAVYDLLLLLLVAMASLVAAATIGNSILRPLLAIRQAARDVSAGNMLARASSGGRDEVAVTAQTFDLMVEQLQRKDYSVRLNASRQALVAQLGQQALAGAAVDDLMETAVTRTAALLGVELCKVLRLMPDGLRLKLQAGVGWRPGLVGTAIIGTERESQAGYTLLSKAPVVVEDLAKETRFSSPALLLEHGVVSGLSVVVGGREQPFGVLGAHTAQRRHFTEDDVNFLQAVANVLAAAIERQQAEVARTELLQREQAARAEAEAGRQRVALLAEAGVLLSRSLDYQATLDALSSLIVPRLADWCSVTLVENGEARRVIAAHRDPDRLWLVQELHKLLPPDQNSGVGEVLKTGTPALYAVVDNAITDRLGPEQLMLTRSLRVRSTMIVPLIARGRTLGAISFARSGDEQPYGQQDLALAEELARRGALALDNARLYHEAQEAIRHKDESYALLDTLLNSAPVGFAFLDRDLRFVRVNQALESLGGPDRFVGKLLHEVMPRLQVRLEPLLRSVLETGQPVLDYPLPLNRHWLCSFYPVRTGAGEVLGVGVVVTDITDQRKMEEALRESEAILAGQNQVLELIAAGKPLELVLDRLSQFVEEQSDGGRASVMLLERSGRRLYHALPPRLPEPFWRALDGIGLSPESGACAAAVSQKATIIIDQIGSSPLWQQHRELAETHGIAACWALPIQTTNGDGLGVLAVYSSTGRLPTAREMTALQLSARLAGIAVERWQAEQARELKLQRLFQNMVEGVIAVNADGRIWLVNQAASDLLSLEHPVEGQVLSQAMLPESLAEMLGRAASSTGAQAATLTFACGDGSVDAHVAPVLPGPGSPFGAIALLQDSTAHAQFRHLQESFVANVSHELRGPLTTLSAMIEGMADGVLPDKERPRYFRAALDEIGRLRRLTRDLLELSRLDAGMVEIEVEEFDIALMLKGLETKWGPRCTAAGLTLSCQCPELRVQADVDRLEQVLTNLLDNAIRFTPPGGRVTVRAAAEGKMVRVSVSDTGPGISREHLPYVWERFYKTDQARTRTPESGTGLGLAIARQWVERMGGEVHVDSEPGQGASFSFTLPRSRR